MWSETVDLVLVDDDHPFAEALATELKPAGFATRIADSLDEACTLIESATCDILVVGFHQAGDMNLNHYQVVLEKLVDICTTALVPEDSQHFDDLLHQVGFDAVLSRELPSRRLAQVLASQGEILHLKHQNYRLRQMLDTRTAYETLMGGSPPMQSLYRLLDQVARTDAPVLVNGEKGTERIEVARSVHRKSKRAPYPLVIVDCMEGQDDDCGEFLFGPMGQGEYASGPHPQQSAFARARNGTVVLHRVDYLRAQAQRRLLDFLRQPFFQDETAHCPQPLSRLITTTYPDLQQGVEEGRFLRELYYRVNILQSRVPPLRERREDIPLLAQHFLRTCIRANGDGNGNGAGLSVSSRAWLHLFQYDWPGNLKELAQLMQSLRESVTGAQIELEDLPEKLRQAGTPPPELRAEERCDVPLKEAKHRFEAEYFKDLLLRTHGNMTLASRFSRVGRPYLYKKIREYGLQPDQFR